MDIINFCKKENIKLTFVIAPTPEWNIVGKKKYQEYHDFVQSIADKYDLDFLDFNLCKPKYFDASDLSLFKDTHHLNKIGSEQFSNVFADFIVGKILKKDLFYDTLQKKLDSEEPKVFGLGRPKDYEKLNWRLISNKDKINVIVTDY